MQFAKVCLFVLLLFFQSRHRRVQIEVLDVLATTHDPRKGWTPYSARQCQIRLRNLNPSLCCSNLRPEVTTYLVYQHESGVYTTTLQGTYLAVAVFDQHVNYLVDCSVVCD